MKLDALLDRLVQDLTAAAHEDVAAAVAEARTAAQQAAEGAVAAVRAEGEARLSAAQAVNAGLLEDAEAARLELAAVQTASRAELDRTRADFEARLEQAEEARAEIVVARDVAGAHLEAQTRRVSELDEAIARETARADGLAAALESEQRRAATLDGSLEAERRRAATLDGSLEAERRRAEALDDALGIERRRTATLDDDVKTSQRRARELDDALKAETRRTSELAAALDAARHHAGAADAARGGDEGDSEAMLGVIAAALKSIDRATSPGEILEALIEPLKEEFASVGIFLAGASAFRGWRGRGFGSSPDISDMVIPRAADSLLTRAAEGGARVFADASARKAVAGLSGSPVARAVALPVLAQDRVIAVAYGEDREASRGAASPGPGCRIAEMLIEHATLRLTARHQPAAPPAPASPGGPASYSPTRAARRVRIKDPVDVTVDGASSSLVDLSVVGAQVLSPNAMRPNRVVRMTLRAGRSSVACKGRVVWARFEQPHGTAASQYRVGVKFTESEPEAIETFLTRHGVTEDSGAYAVQGAKAAI